MSTQEIITDKRKWLQKSVEDNNGKASSRKLTAFVGMGMLVVSWLADLIFDKTVSDILLYSICIMTGLSFGLFTAENVVQILKRNSYDTFFNRHDTPDQCDGFE